MYKRLLLLLLCVAGTHTFASDDWQSLFDGRSLNGWQANERPSSWIVKDGAIVTNGERSHLFYVGNVAQHNFKNFIFSAMVKSESGANSGIYIHTQLSDDHWPSQGYELQIYNARPQDQRNYIERKMTGSVYAVRNTWQTFVKDNEWFEYQIVVSGKTIQTYINGQLICDYTESEQPWRAEDKLKRLLSSGTFALQAHDPDSVVHFKDLKVKVLPDDAPSLGKPLTDQALNRLISKFSNDNIPLIDITENPSSDAALARQLGMTFVNAAYATTHAENGPSTLLEINDEKQMTSTSLLQMAKTNKVKLVFNGGKADLLNTHLLERLKLIEEAQLGWQDFWVPN